MAHIPDGFLSPSVLAGTAAASAAALAVAARRSRATLGEREAPILGAATAFIFAAQTLNFPLGAGTSAHLLGGTLVAVILGPSSAMLVVFAVVLIQALLFQDGGLAALGANTLNLAVLGVGVGWLLFRWGYALAGAGRRSLLAAATVAAYGSTAVVGGSHAIVGLAEAALTFTILALVARSRPELLAHAVKARPAARRLAWGAALGSLALAVFAAYLGSARPDALQSAAARLGLGRAPGAGFRAPLADYTAPIGGPWVAAAFGVVIVFGLVWGAATLAAARRRP